jgi:hypothetical protein
MEQHQTLSRANLMCGNRTGCCKRRSSSAMGWPVSTAVELATERSTAFGLGFLRLGSVALGMVRTIRLVFSSLWTGNVFVESMGFCKKLNGALIVSTLSRQLTWRQFSRPADPKTPLLQGLYPGLQQQLP